MGFAIFIDKLSKFQTKMSWVRTAVENVKLQGYERLHQTVFGGYGTKPDVRISPVLLCLRKNNKLTAAATLTDLLGFGPI